LVSGVVGRKRVSTEDQAAVISPPKSVLVNWPMQLLDPITLPKTDTYTLTLVPPANATGTISVQIYSSSVTASVLADGPAVPVTVPATTAGKRISVTFAGVAGQQVYALNEGTASLGWCTVTLFDPAGKVISPPKSVLVIGAQQLLGPVTLPADGTYTMTLIPPASATGTISVKVLTYPYFR